MQPSPSMRRNGLWPQRGATLLESLVAFVVLAMSTVAAARLQTGLRLEAELARQRSEAVRLGARDLETLRAWSALSAASGVASYADIVDADAVIDAATGYASNTDYRLARRIDATSLVGARQARVSVEWTGRDGSARHIALASVIAGNEPAWSGALAIGADAENGRARGAFGRSSVVPVTARSLGDGRSALKTAAASDTAFVFGDANGRIVAVCSGLAPALATRDLGAADLDSCDDRPRLLLEGTVRFTSAVPPDAAQAGDAPPAVGVAVALDGGGDPPLCSTEAMKTVRFDAAGGPRVETVPVTALPASLGAADWTDTGDRFVLYRCAVTVGAGGRWSGRSSLVPAGWTVGVGASDRRVCRLTADLDRSGAIDANIEHPARYVDVADALTGQNFVVVRGDQSCPAGSQ